jgi:hypothetical protein
MNRQNHHLCPRTEADLEKLIQPLASYIAAGSQQHVAVIAAMTLLLNNLQLVNDAAMRQIAAFGENRFG